MNIKNATMLYVIQVYYLEMINPSGKSRELHPDFLDSNAICVTLYKNLTSVS